MTTIVPMRRTRRAPHGVRRQQARAMYESADRPKLKTIGERLRVPYGTLRKWRERERWQRSTPPMPVISARPPRAASTRVVTPCEHPPMPRCSITGLHTNCGYFADQDPEERAAHRFVVYTKEERLRWRATCLARRRLPLTEIAEQLDLTTTETLALLPEMYRKDLVS